MLGKVTRPELRPKPTKIREHSAPVIESVNNCFLPILYCVACISYLRKISQSTYLYKNNGRKRHKYVHHRDAEGNVRSQVWK